MNDSVNELDPLRLGVWPFEAARIAERSYAALIFSIGYESRSTFLPRKMAGSTSLVGFTFEDHRVEAFEDNLKWSSANGDVVEAVEAEYRDAVSSAIAPYLEATSTLTPSVPARIAVDISSMTRQRIADTFLALHRDVHSPIEVDWIYAPATYAGSAPSGDGIVTNRAVRGFEGWGDPSAPAACVLGAGFEGDLALGVIDDIEPQDVWALVPRGYSDRHDREIDQRNAGIFSSIDPRQMLEYRLDQPFETLLKLDSLLRGIVPQSRAVLIPLGPKVFALSCFILAASAPSDVTVWRVSAESNRRPRNRKAAGDLYGLSIQRVE